jgi:hypothetical protein
MASTVITSNKSATADTQQCTHLHIHDSHLVPPLQQRRDLLHPLYLPTTFEDLTTASPTPTPSLPSTLAPSLAGRVVIERLTCRTSHGRRYRSVELRINDGKEAF